MSVCTCTWACHQPINKVITKLRHHRGVLPDALYWPSLETSRSSPRKTSTLDLPSSCMHALEFLYYYCFSLLDSGRLDTVSVCIGRLGRRVRHNPRSLACTNVAGWRHGFVFFKKETGGKELKTNSGKQVKKKPVQETKKETREKLNYTRLSYLAKKKSEADNALLIYE